MWLACVLVYIYFFVSRSSFYFCVLQKRCTTEYSHANTTRVRKLDHRISTGVVAHLALPAKLKQLYWEVVSQFPEHIELLTYIHGETSTQVFPSGNTLWFLHEPPQPFANEAMRRSHNRLIWLNTEHMSRSDIKDRAVLFMDSFPGMIYVDYSCANLRMSPRMGHWFPYLPQPNLLFEAAPGHVVEYDVFFMGWLTDRRKILLEQLKGRGLRVGLPSKRLVGAERNTFLSMAHVLLNVHNFDDWTTFEAIRCNAALFSGITVISETSAEEKLLYRPAHLVFADYKDLVAVTEAVVNECKARPEGRCKADASAAYTDATAIVYSAFMSISRGTSEPLLSCRNDSKSAVSP